ncbi:hypothetical protein FDUTEX481_06037 [Tolypothrix sp. PCC 7601]|nr:hypothetical protein FDUTEX481_06037 [Tolypothrix sp. PCC 7601]
MSAIAFNFQVDYKTCFLSSNHIQKVYLSTFSTILMRTFPLGREFVHPRSLALPLPPFLRT